MRALLLLACLPGLAFANTDDHQSWSFRVLLDDREIGRHVFVIRRAGAITEVISQANFSVRWLFLEAYRYRHAAREQWHGDCLQSLEADTLDNGRRSLVRGDSRDGALAITTADDSALHEGCVMSFAYWNPAILNSRQLLNSQTGELQSVQVRSLGSDWRSVRGEQRLATRHRIQAPGMAIDLWYAGTEWIGLETEVAMGRRLRYELG